MPYPGACPYRPPSRASDLRLLPAAPLALLATGCGGGPTSVGMWTETNWPQPSSAMHLAIGPANDGKLVWRATNLFLDSAGLITTVKCNGWTGTGTGVHFGGVPASAFGAKAGSDAVVTAKQQGTEVTLEWTPSSMLQGGITSSYRYLHPNATLPQAVVLVTHVALTGSVGAGAKTLTLDQAVTYTDPSTGKAIASDHTPGITLKRASACW